MPVSKEDKAGHKLVCFIFALLATVLLIVGVTVAVTVLVVTRVQVPPANECNQAATSKVQDNVVINSSQYDLDNAADRAGNMH